MAAADGPVADELVDVFRALANLNRESRERVIANARAQVEADRDRASGRYRSNPTRSRDVKRIWRRSASGMSLKAWARRVVAAFKGDDGSTLDGAELAPKVALIRAWLGAKS